MPDTIQQVYFSPAEAAKIMGCDTSTVYRRIKDGTLQPRKWGGKTKLTREEIDRAGLEGARKQPKDRRSAR